MRRQLKTYMTEHLIIDVPLRHTYGVKLPTSLYITTRGDSHIILLSANAAESLKDRDVSRTETETTVTTRVYTLDPQTQCYQQTAQ